MVGVIRQKTERMNQGIRTFRFQNVKSEENQQIINAVDNANKILVREVDKDMKKETAKMVMKSKEEYLAYENGIPKLLSPELLARMGANQKALYVETIKKNHAALIEKDIQNLVNKIRVDNLFVKDGNVKFRDQASNAIDAYISEMGAEGEYKTFALESAKQQVADSALHLREQRANREFAEQDFQREQFINSELEKFTNLISETGNLSPEHINYIKNDLLDSNLTPASNARSNKKIDEFFHNYSLREFIRGSLRLPTDERLLVQKAGRDWGIGLLTDKELLEELKDHSSLAQTLLLGNRPPSFRADFDTLDATVQSKNSFNRNKDNNAQLQNTIDNIDLEFNKSETVEQFLQAIKYNEIEDDSVKSYVDSKIQVFEARQDLKKVRDNPEKFSLITKALATQDPDILKNVEGVEAIKEAIEGGYGGEVQTLPLFRGLTSSFSATETSENYSKMADFVSNAYLRGNVTSAQNVAGQVGEGGNFKKAFNQIQKSFTEEYTDDDFELFVKNFVISSSNVELLEQAINGKLNPQQTLTLFNNLKGFDKTPVVDRDGKYIRTNFFIDSRLNLNAENRKKLESFMEIMSLETFTSESDGLDVNQVERKLIYLSQPPKPADKKSLKLILGGGNKEEKNPEEFIREIIIDVFSTETENNPFLVNEMVEEINDITEYYGMMVLREDKDDSEKLKNMKGFVENALRRRYQEPHPYQIDFLSEDSKLMLGSLNYLTSEELDNATSKMEQELSMANTDGDFTYTLDKEKVEKEEGYKLVKLLTIASTGDNPMFLALDVESREVLKWVNPDAGPEIVAGIPEYLAWSLEEFMVKEELSDIDATPMSIKPIQDSDFLELGEADTKATLNRKEKINELMFEEFGTRPFRIKEESVQDLDESESTYVSTIPNPIGAFREFLKQGGIRKMIEDYINNKNNSDEIPNELKEKISEFQKINIKPSFLERIDR